MNKDNCEWNCEWVEYDEIVYEELKVRAITIAKQESPPKKINANSTFWLCQMCKFKQHCHG
jgi:hypothetical protein